MLRRAPLVVLGLFLLAAVTAGAVAGCGTTRSTPGGGGGGKETPPIATAPIGATIIPSTGESGNMATNITITTDKSRYQATDAIQITVTNHTTTPIFAAQGREECGIFAVQVKTAAGWQPISFRPCVDSVHPTPTAVDDAMLITISPERPYTASIQPRQPGTPPVALSGTYRLALTFSTYTVPPSMKSTTPGGLSSVRTGANRPTSPVTTAYSAAFVVE